MTRRSISVSILILLLASISAAQEPASATQAPAQTLVFNIEILEFNSDVAKEIERLAQDRARVERLAAEGKMRPVADLVVRTRSGEGATVRAGQRVPVHASSLQNTPQVQYENTGLSVTITPTLTTGNQVLAALSLELTAVDRSTGTLTPAFVSRSSQHRIRMKLNERVILVSLVQQGSLLPGTPDSRASESAYGNFVVLLSARMID
ncbi:MAG TPA: hypothetical protein VJQ56_12390 [Blastocatellia bacterium]|nr:hypothetical protein [Blastocatellia bacterium]